MNTKKNVLQFPPLDEETSLRPKIVTTEKDVDAITGQINLSIPQSTSASFAARVTTGSISVTDLVLNDQYVTPTIVTGTLGTGSGSIDLQIITGNIRVTGE